MEAAKAENMLVHEAEIFSRPARTWFQAPKEDQPDRKPSKSPRESLRREGQEKQDRPDPEPPKLLREIATKEPRQVCTAQAVTATLESADLVMCKSLCRLQPSYKRPGGSGGSLPKRQQQCRPMISRSR